MTLGQLKELAGKARTGQARFELASALLESHRIDLIREGFFLPSIHVPLMLGLEAMEQKKEKEAIVLTLMEDRWPGYDRESDVPPFGGYGPPAMQNMCFAVIGKLLPGEGLVPGDLASIRKISKHSERLRLVEEYRRSLVLGERLSMVKDSVDVSESIQPVIFSKTISKSVMLPNAVDGPIGDKAPPSKGPLPWGWIIGAVSLLLIIMILKFRGKSGNK